MKADHRLHNRQRCIIFIVIVTICLSLAAPAVAQRTNGSISGRVVDRAGAVLQGARVQVLPLGVVTATDAQGEFSIPGVAPGSEYTVEISYVGFANYTAKVTVAAGQVARVEAQLNVASTAEQITVTERVHGEVEAINRERESDNILQVLPVEVITSLPNTNIADALGRLPSVTLERDEGEGKYVQIRGTQPAWSNVTIDGMEVPSPEGGVRQIKLDTMPANLVESVEINKTLAPNQDGDAIGGSVNLITKSADRPTIYINGLVGHTPIIGGRSLYEVDSTIGNRFGASKKLGVLIGGSYDWNGRGIDDVEPSVGTVQCDPGPTGCLSPSSNAPFFPTSGGIDIREYRYYRSRYGAAGTIDYKLGELSGLFIRGIYSHFNNFGDRWVWSPGFGTPAGNNGTLNNGDGSISYNSQIRRPVDVIGGVDAGGKHVFAKWTLGYDVSVARSSEEDHGYASASFSPLSSSPLNAIPFTYDTTNPHTPKLIPPTGTNIFDPTQLYLTGSGILDVSHTYSPQMNIQTGFSLARSYTAGGHFGTLEIGFKFRNAHKFQDTVDNTYDGVDPTTLSDPSVLQMSSFLGTFTNSNYYDHAYTLGPVTDYGKIRTFFDANHGPASSPFSCDPNEVQTAIMPFDCIATQQNTIPNNYDLVEHVTAGYAMNTIDLGKFRLIAGLRLEATSEALHAFSLTFDDTGALTSYSPLTRNSSYLDPLPSVQLRYQLPHDAALRLAYGRRIARPNFADIPPFFNHNGPNQEVDIGDPYLKPTHANNYDILYEQYLKPVGLLQAGFFYKQIADPIYEGVRTSIDNNVAAEFNIPLQYLGWDLVRPVNGASARLYGFEIAYQQHLAFLPHALGGIGISANYSYTNSSTDGVPGRTDKPPLQRQAPNTWNISPTYDRGRVSARLGLSYNAANIFQYNYTNLNSDGTPVQPGAPLAITGLKGPNGDVYLYSHLQVDAQAQIRMYRGLQLVVAGLNLTNEVFGFYQGSPQYPIQREYYKPSYMFGLRYTLSNEPK